MIRRLDDWAIDRYDALLAIPQRRDWAVLPRIQRLHDEVSLFFCILFAGLLATTGSFSSFYLATLSPGLFIILLGFFLQRRELLQIEANWDRIDVRRSHSARSVRAREKLMPVRVLDALVLICSLTLNVLSLRYTDRGLTPIDVSLILFVLSALCSQLSSCALPRDPDLAQESRDLSWSTGV